MPTPWWSGAEDRKRNLLKLEGRVAQAKAKRSTLKVRIQSVQAQKHLEERWRQRHQHRLSHGRLGAHGREGGGHGGKSNLIEALRLLSWIGQGKTLGSLHDAVQKQNRGIRGIARDLDFSGDHGTVSLTCILLTKN